MRFFKIGKSAQKGLKRGYYKGFWKMVKIDVFCCFLLILTISLKIQLNSGLSSGQEVSSTAVSYSQLELRSDT